MESAVGTLDVARIKADFRESWWGTLLVDRLLRRE